MHSLKLRNSLVFQALVVFILFVVCIGAINIALNYSIGKESIRLNTLSSANGLLNTVEPSAQVAAFLNDKNLAKEIVRGLLSNDLIAKVILLDSSNNELSSGNKEIQTFNVAVNKELYSPFDTGEVVGVIKVELNQAVISRLNRSYLFNLLMPLALQTLAVSLIIALFIWQYIKPKVEAFLEDINGLDIEKGEVLPLTARKSEVDALRGYINHLIERMYNLVKTERLLRNKSEIQQRKFQAIYDNARSGIALSDRDGKILSLNNACTFICQSINSEANTGTNLINLLAANDYEVQTELSVCLKDSTRLHLEIFYPNNVSDGGIWLQISLTPVDETSVMAIINDITALKKESLEAKLQARTDPLTQLGNRLGFDQEFKKRINKTAQGLQSLTLMTIDLDQFKQVNDRLGHDVGDQVLLYVANQLQEVIRQNDYCARIGGDEFNILLDNMNQTQSAVIARRIVDSFKFPIHLTEQTHVCIGASIGVVFVPQGVQAQKESLLKRADRTMYKIKHNGKNNFAIVDYSVSA